MSDDSKMSTIDKWSERIQPVVAAITNSKVINSIIGGMLAALPAVVIGAFASILLNINVGNFQTFLADTGIAALCGIVSTFTINFIAVLYTISIAFTFAKQYDEDPIGPTILSVIVFFILTPLPESGGIISGDWVGAMGIFTGIIIALSVTYLYVVIKQRGMVIAMPDTVPPVVANSFASLIPSIIVVIIFMVIAGLFKLTPYGSVHEMIYGVLQAPLTKLTASFPSFVLLTFLGAILWWFGIQGTMVTMGTVLGLILALDAENLAAYSAGLTPPNITGWAFYYTYTITNGLLGLNILMLFAKSKRYSTVGKITIVPSICGITEPVLFGTPIVYDLVMFIPFVLTQVLSVVLAWGATYIHLIPTTAGVFTAGGMPVIVTGFIQGSWKIAVFQVFLILLQVAIWYPCFQKERQSCLRRRNGHARIRN